MIKLDTKIMAVLARKGSAERVCDEAGVGYDNIVYDDRGITGGGGAWYNAKRIWMLPADGFTHRMILQDDIVLSNGFLEYAQKAIEKYPDAIWTFYNGCWIKPAVKKVNSPYCRVNGCKMGGCAICIPVEHIAPMIEFTDGILGGDFKHDDGRVGLYALLNGIPVMCTIPGMSDHLQMESTIPNHHIKNRVSDTFEYDVSGENWDSDQANESAWVVNDIWLPKKSARAKIVERLIANAKKEQKGERAI